MWCISKQVEHGSLCGYVVERSSTRWSRMNVSLACEILMNQTVSWPNAVFYGLLPLKFVFLPSMSAT